MAKNETGISMHGSIVNTNKAKAIKCNCSKCYWSKMSHGVVYCKYYKKNNPQKSKCKKFYLRSAYERQDKTLDFAPRTDASEITSYQPAFPWERPVGGGKWMRKKY